jgi:hypothetical protein
MRPRISQGSPLRTYPRAHLVFRGVLLTGAQVRDVVARPGFPRPMLHMDRLPYQRSTTLIATLLALLVSPAALGLIAAGASLIAARLARLRAATLLVATLASLILLALILVALALLARRGLAASGLARLIALPGLACLTTIALRLVLLLVAVLLILRVGLSGLLRIVP